MAEWIHTLFYFYVYIIDNLNCLFFYLELLFRTSLYLMSYNDLLVDIAESFGVWVTVIVLLSSYVSTLVIIHHVSGYSSIHLKSSNNLPNLISYKLLKKYFLFKNII